MKPEKRENCIFLDKSNGKKRISLEKKIINNNFYGKYITNLDEKK